MAMVRFTELVVRFNGKREEREVYVNPEYVTSVRPRKHDGNAATSIHLVSIAPHSLTPGVVIVAEETDDVLAALASPSEGEAS